MTVQWDQYHRQLQTVRQWLERWQAFIVNDDGQYVEVDLETGRPAE